MLSVVTRLFRREESLPKPNCYGLARYQLGISPTDEYRDPDTIWDDCRCIGRLPVDMAMFGNIPHLRREISVIKPSEARLLAFLDYSQYIGRCDVVHVVANIENADGCLLHRVGCGKAVEPISLNDLLEYHELRGHLPVGFI